MSEPNTPPAGDQAEITSLSDALASRNEDRQEVGYDEGPAPAVAPISAATPAPVAQPAAPAAPSAQPALQAASEASPAAQAEDRSPKWYRDHMAQVNRERQAERAEVERLRTVAPQPQRQAPQNLPDPLEDPQAYAHAIRAEMRRDQEIFQLTTTLNLSERFARQSHGGEAFEECKAWLSTKPDIEAWAIQQPDPWSAAFTQYNRERLSEEIGDDPNAWREKERQRIREELQAELAGQSQEPQHNPAARPPMTRAAPPPPASGVRSAAPRGGDRGFTGPTPLSEALKGSR
jgi:hypothetical protein